MIIKGQGHLKVKLFQGQGHYEVIPESKCLDFYPEAGGWLSSECFLVWYNFGLFS